MKQKKADRVLVAVISRQKDLHIALSNLCYRIPLKHLPKQDFSWIALYQTKAFNPAGGMIRWYAPIIRQHTMLRKELLPSEPDHPRAQEEYAVFRLGKPECLPVPVRNLSGQRVTFGYTTLRKLKQADDISQLFRQRSLELFMKRLLKKAGVSAKAEHAVVARGRIKYRLDFALFCPAGKVDIECDSERYHNRPSQRKRDYNRNRYLRRHGWKVLRFKGKELLEHPHKCLEKIMTMQEALS